MRIWWASTTRTAPALPRNSISNLCITSQPMSDASCSLAAQDSLQLVFAVWEAAPQHIRRELIRRHAHLKQALLKHAQSRAVDKTCSGAHLLDREAQGLQDGVAAGGHVLDSNIQSLVHSAGNLALAGAGRPYLLCGLSVVQVKLLLWPGLALRCSCCRAAPEAVALSTEPCLMTSWWPCQAQGR